MVLYLFILTTLITPTWSTTYNLSDLEVLANEGAYAEFFDHAMDIRPSERQEKWKEMVVRMGDILSQKVLAKTEVERKDFLNVENLYTWPTLKSDDVFRIRRQEIGLKYLKKCFKKSDSCWKDLGDFWDKDKRDPDLAVKLAEMTLDAENSPYSTWSFLEVALKSPLSEFYCKKDFVMKALWGKIELDYIKLGPEGDLMKKIDLTVHPDCLPILITEAKARLHQPKNPNDRELSYQILKSQGKATTEITDFFYTTYLLENPSKGELFNYSWNRIHELGKSPGRRDSVLTKLKGLDPLPDSILSTLDQTKKKVVLKHFRANFPEYLDLYIDKCIAYFAGKGSFPAGNPTIHCQEFMNSETATEVIDTFKLKQYQEARKI